ncbi:D-2-hydroxyacid dehydrogenase family protein [Pontibacter fetidus]|uniref:D-2-hydroxyacid dehydrogenase family protein n=1 Tax=Pontibacter fetidus TaxID=2700082 RepID=A0A6B2GZD3_9BACT|nr:D-2-hydroxyacid dehydrogenase family protein [Pontibacter fetidus]NDK55391.1 D-2-hydroxyacid dehydrogenase family protein [Pontibacter fetidus]
MHIIIPDDYQHIISTLDCFQLLHQHQVTIYHDTVKDIDLLVERFKTADALVLTRERTAITKELVSRLPRLKLISQTGKISNHLDLAACTNYTIAVAEGTGSPVAPAELAWLLIMNALRQVPQAIAAMKEGKWQTNIGSTINGKLIGIWGYGKIGKLIAGYANAFGAKVIVWGSENSRDKAVQDGHLEAESKAAFFAQADVVTLHLRLTETTRNIVTAADLAQMKRDAVLVNTSRAELIEEGALLQALKQGRPGFAALDVYETEPILDKDYPLLQLSNVICTPHLGYVEKNGYELYFRKAFENVVAFANGTPTNIANPEVLQL